MGLRQFIDSLRHHLIGTGQFLQRDTVVGHAGVMLLGHFSLFCLELTQHAVHADEGVNDPG